MRTREKPPRNTYEKRKEKKTTPDQFKASSHTEYGRYKKSRRHATDSRQIRSRRILLKCTLSAAVFTITLTAAAGWQVLKTRISSWQEFSAKTTSLILSDSDADQKLLQQYSNGSLDSDPGDSDYSGSSSDLDDADRFGSSSDSDDADRSNSSSDLDDADRSGSSSDLDDTFHSKDLSGRDAEFRSQYSSKQDILAESVVPSDSFAALDYFGTADPNILKREPLTDTTIDTEGIDHIASVSNDWNLILVNPWNPLPDNYEITLAPLPNGHFIDQRCYAELMEMLEDCRAAGLSPLICSSYRTQQKQETLFQERVDELIAQGYPQKEARKKAATSVARPGTSEHQAGLAVDLVDSSYQFLNSSQEYTKVQQWLMENSWKYGFILRYPSEKSSLTGIIYEPWHYRYVGKKAAEEIYRRGLCLEEYLAEHFDH